MKTTTLLTAIGILTTTTTSATRNDVPLTAAAVD